MYIHKKKPRRWENCSIFICLKFDKRKSEISCNVKYVTFLKIFVQYSHITLFSKNVSLDLGKFATIFYFRNSITDKNFKNELMLVLLKHILCLHKYISTKYLVIFPCILGLLFFYCDTVQPQIYGKWSLTSNFAWW